MNGTYSPRLGRGLSGLTKMKTYMDEVWEAISTNPYGTHFYVNRYTGNDEYNGLSAQKPKKTLQAAIDLCEPVDANMWNGDIIHVAKGTLTVTEAVEFNVRGITVMADQVTAPFTLGEPHCIYGSHDDGPAATILEPCRLIGLGFCGSQAAGPSLLIDCEEQGSWPGGFSLIDSCRFSHWGIAKAYAVQIKGTGDNQIQNCLFDGLWTGYTGAGIYCEDSGALGIWNLGIQGNRFMNIGSGKYCIEVKSGSHLRQCVITDNVNIGSALFFKSNANAGDGLIGGNYTGGATDTASYDRSVAQLIAQGFDVAGNHYSEA